MNCPRCSVPLRGVDLAEFGGEYASVVIDLCPGCGGVWLDKGELDKRDESVWTDAEAIEYELAVTDRDHLTCPKCFISLSSIAPVDTPGLILDRCPECLGFWVDPDEIEAVQSMAAAADSESRENMTTVPRPPDMAWLNWSLFLIGMHHSRWSV